MVRVTDDTARVTARGHVFQVVLVAGGGGISSK